MQDFMTPPKHVNFHAKKLFGEMGRIVDVVTLVKTLDVCRLVKVSKRNGMKFTMMMCWCIGKTASQVEEFFTLPVDGKLYHYDKLFAQKATSSPQKQRSSLAQSNIPGWCVR